jgi:uncharacterized DUF497 family protein
MHYRFEWDSLKARANVAKHGVTFDEAQTVFTDRWAIEAYDWEHSLHEDRLKDHRHVGSQSIAHRGLHASRSRDNPHHQRPTNETE